MASEGGRRRENPIYPPPTFPFSFSLRDGETFMLLLFLKKSELREKKRINGINKCPNLRN
jgi:hypothetical protein